MNRTNMEVMKIFRYLYGLVHSNVLLLGEPWISMSNALPLFTIDCRVNNSILLKQKITKP